MSEATAREKINKFLYENEGNWFAPEVVAEALKLHRGRVTRLLKKLYKSQLTNVFIASKKTPKGGYKNVYSFRGGMR